MKGTPDWFWESELQLRPKTPNRAGRLSFPRSPGRASAYSPSSKWKATGNMGTSRHLSGKLIDTSLHFVLAS